MKLKHLLVIICCLIFCSTYAQQNNTLRGKILYLNSGKQPAVGVKIAGTVKGVGVGVENANLQYTTNDGSFELKFPAERDGHQVRLEIGEEDQYGQSIEVVNDKEVEICRIPAIATDEFEIIVCANGSRDLAAQNYYNIIKTSSDIALEEKKKELDNLLAAQQKDYKQISTLTDKIAQLEKQTDSLVIYRTAWRIASVNKDNANERVLKYIDALDKGKTIQQALNMLNIELAAKQVDKGIKIADEGIEELVLCAEGSMSIFDYNSAIACYDTIIVKMEEMDKNPLLIANYYNDMLLAALGGGKYEKALIAGNNAINIREEILEPKHLALAASYSSIAEAYHYLGLYKKALSYNNKSITIRNEILNPLHPDLAQGYNNIAGSYRFLGEYDKALLYQQKSIFILKEILNSKHPKLANSYNNLGVIYGLLEKYELALSYEKAALDIFEEILPSKHPDLARYNSNIADIYRLLGKNDTAFLYQQKSIDIAEEVLDPEHFLLTIYYENMALIYQGLKQFAKALKLQLKSISIREEILEPNHPSFAFSYNNIALSYLALNNNGKALEFQKKSFHIAQEALPENHPQLEKIFNSLITIYENNAFLAFKREDYNIAISNLLSLNEYSETGENWYNIGTAYFNLKDYSNAIQAYQKTVILFPEFKSQHYYLDIGIAYLEDKQFKKAKKSFKAYEKLFPNEGGLQRNWAMYYALQNDTNKALTHLQKAIDLGYDDLEWLKTDDSMDSLREEPLFKEMIESLEKKEAEKEDDQK